MSLRIKKLLWGLFTFSFIGVSNIAFADKIAKPVASWEVSAIGDATISSYCVAANAFDNHSIVVIAYETGQKSSIAFNIQESLFELGLEYPVTLFFSNGTEGRFVAHADNQSTLIIQAGADPQLWENITSSNFLRFAFKDQERLYDLSGLEDVYHSLQTCTGINSTRYTNVKSSLPQISVMPTIAEAEKQDSRYSPLDSQVLALHEEQQMTMIDSYDQKSSFINDLLDKSSVAVEELEPPVIVDKDYIHYIWTTAEGLKGAFDQVYWPQNKSFHDLVQDYFARHSQDCMINFMPMASEAYRIEDLALAEGQAFCKGGDGEYVFSYLFYATDNIFTTIEHRGSFDQMEAALNIREKIKLTLETIASETNVTDLKDTARVPVLKEKVIETDVPKSQFVQPSLPSLTSVN